MDFMHAERNAQGHSRGQVREAGGQSLLQGRGGLLYTGGALESAEPVQYEPGGSIFGERWRTDGRQQIDERQQISERRQITKQERIRRNVIREFIAPKHIDALEGAIRSTNTIIGFRAAGAATLAQMDAGAAPKPHTILDKSLKAGEFETFEEAQALLAGLVPYREGGEIKGLHLSEKGFQYLSSLTSVPFTIVKLKNHRKYLKCNPTSTEDPFVNWLLNNLEANPQFEYASWFVTGDYDLHDMVLKTSQGAPVPSDSPDEARILTRISDNVMGHPRGPVKFKFTPDEFSPIQHGPQYNYVAHMMDKERGKPIVGKVADLDLKVALFDGKEWTILDHSMPENLEGLSGQQIEEMKQNRRKKQANALQAYYKKHGLNLKWTWCDSPEATQYIEQF